jgi:hypothetical protein
MLKKFGATDLTVKWESGQRNDLKVIILAS